MPVWYMKSSPGSVPRDTALAPSHAAFHCLPTSSQIGWGTRHYSQMRTDARNVPAANDLQCKSSGAGRVEGTGMAGVPTPSCADGEQVLGSLCQALGMGYLKPFPQPHGQSPALFMSRNSRLRTELGLDQLTY